MSEPYGNKWKQYTVWPKLQNQSGGSVDKIKLNIGDPSSLTGPQGPQGPQGGIGATGPQGPAGNPNMQLTAPNGNVYQITVDNTGNLGTTLISTPPPSEEEGSEGPVGG
tara:strand:+ start:2101 stop:2427 length:327 start_codon:yes stop_codon:yes gene_type:complete